MLSVDKCRKHLADRGKDLSDQEIENLRNLLYQLANVLVDGFLSEKKEKNDDNKTD